MLGLKKYHVNTYILTTFKAPYTDWLLVQQICILFMAALGVVLTELYLLLFWLRSFWVAIMRIVAAGNVRWIHALI
mgnify:CR=1 FL=1